MNRADGYLDAAEVQRLLGEWMLIAESRRLRIHELQAAALAPDPILEAHAADTRALVENGVTPTAEAILELADHVTDDAPRQP